MAISLDQLLYGIRKIESGGNYHVVNGIGAVGAYQVMKANIPSWTRKALGYSMTWQQFRDSRSAQDTVARYILGGYYKKYGAEGAASMWFSGQPNPNSGASDGGNTVRQYVNKVISASGGGSIGGSAVGSTYSVGAVTPTIDKYTLMEQYGLTASMINSNKELKSLFNKAVAGQWDATLFTAKLKNTTWWKTTSDSARKFFLLKTGDPATYKQKYSDTMFKLNQIAVAVGYGNQITKDGKPTSILAKAIIYTMRDGWDDARAKAYFGSAVDLHAGHMWGDAGEAYDQLFALTYSNGLKFADSWFKNNIRQVLSGKTTLETLQGYIRNQAAAKYSAFADQIKAGQNALDLAQPYISSVANVLELPSTDIDLTNKWVNKAMTSKQVGSTTGIQYPIWQFENDLRNDPLWKQTNNARESMFSVAHKVAQDFGFAF